MNLAAFTPPTGPYPPYISVNTENGQDIVITVRAAANQDGSCGLSASITMTKEQFRDLIFDAAFPKLL